MATAQLDQVLEGSPSAAVRTRVTRLLEKLMAPAAAGERLRWLRAITLLEQIGSPRARKVLAALAKGAPASHRTQEAEASLRRLAKRQGE